MVAHQNRQSNSRFQTSVVFRLETISLTKIDRKLTELVTDIVGMESHFRIFCFTRSTKHEKRIFPND